MSDLKYPNYLKVHRADWEALKERAERAEARLEAVFGTVNIAIDCMVKAEARVAKLRVALKFYADWMHIDLVDNTGLEDQVGAWPWVGGDIMHKCESGEFARQALAELEDSTPEESRPKHQPPP